MPERATLRHAAAFALACSLACGAQTRKGPEPPPPQKIVRAVAVYEWTGDRDKPTAARLVPVSLYINDEFQDAALYLSRPVPLALETDNVYELQRSGIAQGTLTLQTAAHMHYSAAASGFDDGWVGYGLFKPEPVLATTASSAPSNAHMLSPDGRPHFGKPSDATPAAPASATPDKQSTTPTSSPATPPPITTASSNDADRPTLRKVTPQQQKRKGGRDEASVTEAGGLLGDDPNRPYLHHGGAEKAAMVPPLKGLPADMKQLVAVSDAEDRPEHNFAYDWSSDTEKARTLSTLESLARTALAPPLAAASAHNTSPHHKTATAAAPPVPITLLDEDLHAIEISYGGGDVYIFTARTTKTDAPDRFVTLIAESDIYGKPQILLQSLTDSAHLDQSPRLLFIDAVDADADNRAELLFELRGQAQRQFALYHVAQGTAQQVYLSGGTQ